MNYSTIFAEKKQLEDSLDLCMKQYEERLRRVNDYMEQSNSDYLTTQEELKQTKLKQDSELRLRDQILTQLMEKSNQIRTKAHRLFEGKKAQQNQGKIRESLNDIELQVAKMLDINSESDQLVMEMRDHIMDLF